MCLIIKKSTRTKPSSIPVSQKEERYILSVPFDDYYKVIETYMSCRVLSKEMETITKIFRQLGFRDENFFDVYLNSLESAKLTLSTIPKFSQSQPKWMTRISKQYHTERSEHRLNEQKNYNKSYLEIENFITEELDRKYHQDYNLNKNRGRISSLLVYNSNLKEFWAIIYRHFMPKMI